MLKLVRAYIGRHIRGIAAFCVCVVIFMTLFFLYGIPIDLIIYGTLLCFCFCTVFFIIDFMQYVKKHRLLLHCLDGIRISIDSLPTHSDLHESDYIEMIRALQSEKAEIISANDIKNRDMMDYYGMWVHQIKTPIAALRLLLENEEDAMADIKAELFKIEQYVDVVLQYARIDSDDFILKRYDLDDIVKQAVRKYATMFIRKKITLQYEPLSKTVLTDEKWLLFVIEQLLSNAIKFTKTGKISIYMDNMYLTVEDTGIGIHKEDIPMVFAKGFTGYNGRTDKKSTGIGLYLCKKILTRLGHSIVIESEYGVGTCVKIDLEAYEFRAE